MIRTGYLRWEIEIEDRRCEQDRRAREAIFRARPSFRIVRVRHQRRTEAADRFVKGEGTYDEVLRAIDQGAEEVDLTIPDVPPRTFRYSESDRQTKLAFWITKMKREANAYAHEIVRLASSFPQLLIVSPAVRSAYAMMVETEILRVLNQVSQPQPTNETEPLMIDAGSYQTGVPELVAAELVRDVVAPEDFDEFRLRNRITVRNAGKLYRISRKPHALIEVWDAATHQPEARLCVIFRDPGMPPSDEVVMKYLLAKHQPQTLWDVGVRFGPPSGVFEP